METIEVLHVSILDRIEKIEKITELIHNLDIKRSIPPKVTPRSVDELSELFMNSITSIFVEYGEFLLTKQKQQETKHDEKYYITRYNNAVLQNNILLTLGDMEEDLKQQYNADATHFISDKVHSAIVLDVLQSIRGLLTKLYESTPIRNESLRHKKKAKEIKPCPKCNKAMSLMVNDGVYLCKICKITAQAYGIVPCDTFLEHATTSKMNNNYRSEINCDTWLDKIQGLDNKEIPEEVKRDLNLRKDNSMLIGKQIKCSKIRRWLKETGHTAFNNSAPKIRYELTGIAPTKLTNREMQETRQLFGPVMDAYNKVKDENKNNSLYQPYFILKIFELIIPHDTQSSELRFLDIVSCIHFQESDTIDKNDIIWEKICEQLGLKYVATDIDYYLSHI